MLQKKKKKEEESPGGNGQGGNSEVLSLLKGIVEKQKEHDERLDEMDEGKGKEAAQLRLVNLAFDPNDHQLMGLSHLALIAVRPFTIQKTLRSIMDPEIRAGTKTLGDVYLNTYLLLMRSVGAEAFNKATELAGEQASQESDKGAEQNL